MIIPSIDLMGGTTVQLIGGREKALDAGEPGAILESFALAGEVAVIDLDAAMGTGSNAALVEGLVKQGKCRVGGGIRDEVAARKWLDAGARKVIVGTAATPELLSRLPRERVMAAVDSVNGRVVVKGWKEGTGELATDVIRRLAPFVGGFLVTCIEREGRLGGLDWEQVESVIAAAGDVRVTIAGGVTSAADVKRLDDMGADAQVGMALYTQKLGLAEAIAAPLRSDRADGLWPTVVVNEMGVALGLAYSNLESLREAVRLRQGVYWSRTRGLWVKGETSGATQRLLRVDLDCDRDALRFVVRQHGAGFCHEETMTCWGRWAGEGEGLQGLERTLRQRAAGAPEGSYSARLFNDEALLASKLQEEARELCEATTTQHVVAEAADVLYFALVKVVKKGGTLADVARELDQRGLKVSRRGGDAKGAMQAGGAR